MQPVDREPGTDGVHALDRSEGGDTRAGRGVDEPRTLGDRAKHLTEAFELDPIVGGVGIVRRREVREDPIDLDMRQRSDRSITGRCLVRGRAEPREPGVHFEMHARVSS